ncbi:MAG: hypothetical protein QOI47_2579, partial [Actinomycetota bacterium]|nr:hypothetical protein [Actinomycetota bacterium]
MASASPHYWRSAPRPDRQDFSAVDLELRPITEDEHPTWNRHIARAFGFHNDEMVIAAWRSVTELDRTLAAFDRGEIVGTAGAFSFEMALPGGATTPVGAVTGVSVRATHRRRGVLSQMMTRQLVDIAERGESMAVLTASETVIYGRFGYGLASHLWEWKIATEGTTLSSPSAATGRVRLIDKEEAAKILPGVRDRAWRRHPGELAWSQAWWDKWFLDRREDRDGASPLFFAVHESDSGEADGYLAWRTKPGWVGGLPDGELVVVQLYGVDEEIEAALWEFALSV